MDPILMAKGKHLTPITSVRTKHKLQPGLRRGLVTEVILVLPARSRYADFLSTSAEFFEPKAMQLHTACSIIFFLPVSGT